MIPKSFVSRLDSLLQSQLSFEEGGSPIDFTQPTGEEALASPNSISWQIFRNPISLYIGGITAVLMELAEPRVRTGVWEHTTFRVDPLRRMRRTGLAAMITVYGGRSVAEKMISGVNRMHQRIEGKTPSGIPYRADDPELLRWVHATALFGFMEAYDRFVYPLSAEQRDQFVAEGVPAADLYGAMNPPRSESEMQAMFDAMLPNLESSEIVFEFLEILRKLSIFPRPLRPFNSLLIRAAVSLLPSQIREKLELSEGFSVPPGGESILRLLGSQVDRLHLKSSPSSQACIRLGKPANHLLQKKQITEDI
ncbi:MAG: oxygenase MpaB family protein [Akkermansiaceae bacterium]